MSIKCSDIASYMNKIAPENMAEEWDNVGLLVGSPEKVVNRVLICLDITSEVIDEAIENKTDMIISHHPVIFKGLKRINPNDPTGNNIIRLIENGICVYSAHTNLDIAKNGVNEALAQKLDIIDSTVIDVLKTGIIYKIVVFVPESHSEAVKNALCTNGAGGIGNYDYCTFSALGKGTYRPLHGAKPFMGAVGNLEKVNETRLETIVPENHLKNAISAMLAAHPYEEPAYDVFKLEIEGKTSGLGRVGCLKKEMGFKDFMDYVKKALMIDNIRVVGEPPSGIIKKVAVFCGSFDLDMKQLAACKTDVLVTGDLKYHDAMEALQMGICIIDAGHYNTEIVVLPVLQATLSEKFNDLDISISGKGKDPFRIYST